MLLSHVLLGVLWMVYCVLHSLLAGLQTKKVAQNKLGAAYKYYRLGYTIFAFAGLGLLVWFQLSMTSVQLYQLSVFTTVAGVVVSLAGLLLMLVCIKKYFLNLSGLRSLVQQENYTKLVVSGVHRYVRHPLYLGTFAFIWGLLLLFPTLGLLLSNTIITVYTLIGIKLEEKKLVLDFGDDYKAYQQAVPKLVPKFGTDSSVLQSRRQNQTVRR